MAQQQPLGRFCPLRPPIEPLRFPPPPPVVALTLPSSEGGGDDMALDGTATSAADATSSSRGSGQLGLVLLERVVKTSLSAMAMMTAPGAGLTATPGTMRAELIGRFKPCMTEIYIHI